MIEIGARVTSKAGDFSGRVLGRHGTTSGVGGAFHYQSLPDDVNVAVYQVLNDETGEVRQFTLSGLVADSA